MVKKKRQSKRVGLQQKYKIINKVKEHKRKLRKGQVVLGKKNRNPGIPNSWPFKEELMHELENERLANIEKRKMEKVENRQNKKQKMQMEHLNLEPVSVSVDTLRRNSLKDCIHNADVVCFVLDARDPWGSRSLTFEDGVIGKGKKKFMLVLNKLDLVEPSVARHWVSVLRQLHPTIPVYASNGAKWDGMPNKSKSSRLQMAKMDKVQHLAGLRDNGNVKCLEAFLQEFSLKMGKKQDGSRQKIAFVGYPNCGKSSIVNALKKRTISKVSSQAVSTIEAKQVQYNEVCDIIDCPSLNAEYSHPVSNVMRHAMANVSTLEPVEVLESILKRCDIKDIVMTFKVPMYKDTEDFLKHYCLKAGILRKGGDTNILVGARALLRDIGLTKVQISCLPPKSKPAPFVLPKWYTSLDSSKLDAAEATVYGTHQPTLLQLSAVPCSNPDVETTEFDIAIGDMQSFLNDDGTDEDIQEDIQEDIEEDIQEDIQDSKDSQVKTAEPEDAKDDAAPAELKSCLRRSQRHR